MNNVLLHLSEKPAAIMVPTPICDMKCKRTGNDHVEYETYVLPGRVHSGHISDELPHLLVLFVHSNQFILREVNSLRLRLLHVELTVFAWQLRKCELQFFTYCDIIGKL